MSTSLREVIEYGGYDLRTLDDAEWLLATQSEYEELIEQAQELIDKEDELETARIDAKYNLAFPKEDDENV